MATTIKLKNSVTATNAPSSLVQGEVAINVTDKKVWVGNAATTPIQLLGGGADGSFTNISVSSVATFGAGTVSLPAITTTGDTNTGIFFPTADTIAFTEGGVESMRIDSSGNVGIGTSSPTALLHVNGTARAVSMSLNGVTLSDYNLYSGMVTRVSNGGGIGINSANSTDNAYIYFGSGTTSSAQQSAAIGRIGGDVLAMFTASAERMRIDSSGNVGINNTSPAVLSSTTQVAIKANASADSMFVAQNSNGLTTAKFGFQFTGGVDNPVIGSYTNHPFLFLTNNTERMRIDSAGNLLLGTTTNTYKLTIGVSSSAGAIKIIGDDAFIEFNNSGTKITGGGNLVLRAAADTQVISGGSGGVSLASGTTSWAAISDETQKDIIEPITDATNKVSKLRAVIGKYKTDTESTRRSFLIAQDVQNVLPEAVSEDEETGILNLRYTETIPLLVAAIQELKAELDSVKAELQTLKGN